MIVDKVLESNVTVLRTPLVDIEIVDEEENSIIFDIVASENTYHIIRKENGDGYYDARDFEERVIRIRTGSLQTGKKYYVRSSVPLEYMDSDPKLFTYGVASKTQSFAISFPDPHDEYKDFPEYCVEDYQMRWYDFNGEAAKGTRAVSFTIIDQEKEYIYISAAWGWDIISNYFNTETALELFTWYGVEFANRLFEVCS